MFIHIVNLLIFEGHENKFKINELKKNNFIYMTHILFTFLFLF